MRHILGILVLVLLSSNTFGVIRINEIMYNPEGNDNNKEFVEIFSDEKINLSDFLIGDTSSNDTLQKLKNGSKHYYLIVEEEFNISGIVSSAYSAGTTIGNGLNTDDSVYLYYNNSIVDNVSYTDSCESGYSLEYHNGSFCCSLYRGGTPGKANSNRKIDYSGIVITEFYPDPPGDDNTPMPGGEFIELYNSGSNSSDLSSLYLQDSSNHRIYISDTTTLNGTRINPEGYLAVYTNGFSGFLNNEDMDEIRLFDPEGNLIDRVAYGGSTEGLSWSKVNSIWQLRLPSPSEKNPAEEVGMESAFRIEAVENLGSDNKAEFGDIIKARISIYKGNTSKQSIKAYIENDETRITKTTKATLYDNFRNYTLTLPLQIYSNCKGKYGEGEYYVRVGWTSSSAAEDSYKIDVEGINLDNCDKIYVERKPRKGTLKHSLLECPKNVRIGEEFCLQVELINNDGIDHYVDLSSYVYRGPKCYSGDRELNKKQVLVRSGETSRFELSNTVDEAEPGEYNIKVKIKRDDQKTEKSVTEKIMLLAAQERTEQVPMGVASTEEEEVIKAELAEKLEHVPELRMVYESSNFKSKKMIPYFLITVLTFLTIFLVVNKKI